MQGFEVAVKAGIVCDGRILVLTPSEPERRHERDLPGGRMEHGEHPLTALRREVREETGLDVELVAPVRMWSYVRANGRQLVGVTWACRASSTRLQLSDEHESHAWLRREDIQPHWPESPELLAVFQTLEALAPVEHALARAHVEAIVYARPR